jgi:hypothetical protein
MSPFDKTGHKKLHLMKLKTWVPCQTGFPVQTYLKSAHVPIFLLVWAWELDPSNFRKKSHKTLRFESQGPDLMGSIERSIPRRKIDMHMLKMKHHQSCCSVWFAKH